MADILRYFLLFIEVVCCILLIGVILIQKSKGQGLGLGFGQAMGESLLGAQAGNVLTKTTVILAITFFLNTFFLAYLYSSSLASDTVMESYETPAPDGSPITSPGSPAQPFSPPVKFVDPSPGPAPAAGGSDDGGFIAVPPAPGEGSATDGDSETLPAVP